MRAVRIHRPGAPEVLQLDNLPAPRPAAGQVTIDVAYAGVNFADVMFRRGTVARELQLPLTPGIEVSGRIRELADDVTGLAVGQCVAGLSTVNAGGYADVVAIDARLVVPLPDDSDSLLRVAAGTPSNTTTAVMALRRAGRLELGEALLVHSAASGLGSQLGQVAAILQAGTITGTVGQQDKIEAARRFGYDSVLLRDQWIGDPAADPRPDLIVDPVGGAVRSASIERLGPDGRLVALGNASGATEAPIKPNELFFAGRTVAGYSLGAISADNPDLAGTYLREAVDLVSSGKVHVDVNTVLDLDSAVDAHRRVESGATTGKTVLRINA